MELLDFLTNLPAEEKDIFIHLLEETGSTVIAVGVTMMILADSEPKLARRLAEPVRDWLKITVPVTNANDLGGACLKINPISASVEPEL